MGKYKVDTRKRASKQGKLGRGKITGWFFNQEFEMNIEEIQQAITKLAPDDLARFRAWFKEYENNSKSGESNDPKESIEDTLKRLRGSLKGTGALKTLMEERRKDRERE